MCLACSVLGAVLFRSPRLSCPQGEAIVYRLNKEHNRQEELARLKAGDYFGEKALLSNAPRGASVMVTGRCVCFYLDRAKFLALFGEQLRHKVRMNILYCCC